jgi:mono/diheme cytochrome c family protein
MTKRVVLVGMLAVSLSGATVLAQDAKKIADGKKIYDSKQCAKCHAIAGKGEKISPLDGVGTKLSEEDIRHWLKAPTEMEAKLDHKPKVKMSSKKIVLTDPEIDAVTAYMLSLKKK